MKKYMLLVGFLWSGVVTQAQGRLGIQLVPGVAFNRVHTGPTSTDFSSAGAAFGFKVGIIYDHPIGENYDVGTGLFYSVLHVAMQKKTVSPSVCEEYGLHYVQVPVLFKLHTSEVALDMRLYVTLGLIGQIRVNESHTYLTPDQAPFVGSFRRWGLGGLLGVGVEYDTSLSTSVFAGVSYHPGLASVMETSAQAAFWSYCDLVGLELGVRL